MPGWPTPLAWPKVAGQMRQFDLLLRPRPTTVVEVLRESGRHVPAVQIVERCVPRDPLAERGRP